MKPRPDARAAGPAYQGIRPEELLPLPVVKQRLRWGDETISKAQRDGLRVLRYGKWGYCLGRDLIDFLERVGTGRNGDGERGDGSGNGHEDRGGPQP